MASGWEKGIVEKNVQDSRRRVWIEAKTQCFNSFEERNAWLDQRCRTLGSEIEHPSYTGITLAAELERTALFDADANALRWLRRHSGPCLQHLFGDGGAQPVLGSLLHANRKATLHLYSDSVDVYTEHAHIARHKRLLGRDEVSYDWQHSIPLIEKKPGALRNGAPFAEMPLLLTQLQTALRHRERQQGDRTMAKVLAAVPAHGLETVLGSVKLLLDSGVTRTEQVLNVLSRLNDVPIPAQVETHLKLNEEPLADTARYDRLNDKEVSHA